MSSLLEQIQNKRKSLKSDYASFEKLPAGKSRWRVLPNVSSSDNSPFQDWGKHFIKDFAGETKATYICLAKSKSEECPICDVINRARTLTTDEATLALLKEAMPSQRFIVNAVRCEVGKDKKVVYGPVVQLELPKGVAEQMMSSFEDFMGEDINVFDLDGGFDFVINREGSGFNTDYKCNTASKTTKLPETIMKGAKDLASFVDDEVSKDNIAAIQAVKALGGMPTAPPALTAVPSAPVTASAAGRTTKAAVVTAAVVSVEETVDDLDDLDLGDVELDELDDIG